MAATPPCSTRRPWSDALDNREKALYHQIHPAKLATDIGVTVPSLWLFWNGELLLGILVTIVPSVVASALVMRYGDLDRLKASRAGAYLARYMGRAVQGVRGLGAVVMIVGAWYHVLWLIALGPPIVLIAWFHGLLLRGASVGTA